MVLVVLQGNCNPEVLLLKVRNDVEGSHIVQPGVLIVLVQSHNRVEVHKQTRHPALQVDIYLGVDYRRHLDRKTIVLDSLAVTLNHIPVRVRKHILIVVYIRVAPKIFVLGIFKRNSAQIQNRQTGLDTVRNQISLEIFRTILILKTKVQRHPKLLLVGITYGPVLEPYAADAARIVGGIVDRKHRMHVRKMIFGGEIVTACIHKAGFPVEQQLGGNTCFEYILCIGLEYPGIGQIYLFPCCRTNLGGCRLGKPVTMQVLGRTQKTLRGPHHPLGNIVCRKNPPLTETNSYRGLIIQTIHQMKQGNIKTGNTRRIPHVPLHPDIVQILPR